MLTRPKSYRRPLLGLMLMVIGARLGWIFIFGGDIPVYDQWRYEANSIYDQLERQAFDWADLAAPNNEHRIVWTTLTNVLIYQSAGWDTLAQQAVSVFLVGFSFLFVAFLIARGPEKLGLDGLGLLLLLLLLYVFPLDYWNLLWGFQTQFYFLTFFSLVHLGWVCPATKMDAKWAGGWACGLFAFAAMGGGFFAATATVFVSLIFGSRIGQPSGLRVWNILLGLGISALGIWTIPDLPQNYFMREAVTPLIFLGNFLSSLAWPFYKWPLLAPWVWCPAVAFVAACMIRKDMKPGNLEIFSIGLALWVLAMSAAIGLTRSSLNPRYFGVLSFTVFVNAVFLRGLWIRPDIWTPRLSPRFLRTAAALWAGSILVGVNYLGIKHLTHEMPNFREAQFSGWISASEYLERGAWDHEYEKFIVRTHLPNPIGVIPVLEMDWMETRGPYSLRREYLKTLNLEYEDKLRLANDTEVNYMKVLNPWPDALLSQFVRLSIYGFPLFFLAGALLLFPEWRMLLFDLRLEPSTGEGGSA